MKKILIAENAENAEVFICELGTKYLDAVRTAYKGMLNLGITPDKELLFGVIAGNFDSLSSKFWEICQPDIDGLSSIVAKTQMKTNLEGSLELFCESIPMIFAFEIDGKSLSNSCFQKYLEIDEKEGPFISNLTKESIRESFKEYLGNEQHLKIFEAHQAAAKALQKFIDEFSKSNLTQARYIRINPRQTIISLFEVEILENDKLSVTPGQINYNFQSDPEEEGFPSNTTTYIPQSRGDVSVTRNRMLNAIFLNKP